MTVFPNVFKKMPYKLQHVTIPLISIQEPGTVKLAGTLAGMIL